MIYKKLAIIGIGNMGKAILDGLLVKNVFNPKDIILSNPHSEKLDYLKQDNLLLMSDNKNAVMKADIVLLAVKPQIIPTVLEEIKDIVSPNSLIISIAAGVTVENIKNILDQKQPIARVMPMLTAQIGQSMSCWTKSKEVTLEQEETIRTMLRSFGKELLIENETMIDKCTVLAGIPAYFFFLANCMQNEAKDFGFTEADGETIINQILLGSAELLNQSNIKPSILQKQVMSKGGTTEAAFNIFSKYNLEKILHEGIVASLVQAKKLALNN